jgi:hypothetical protein
VTIPLSLWQQPAETAKKELNDAFGRQAGLADDLHTQFTVTCKLHPLCVCVAYLTGREGRVCIDTISCQTLTPLLVRLPLCIYGVPHWQGYVLACVWYVLYIDLFDADGSGEIDAAELVSERALPCKTHTTVYARVVTGRGVCIQTPLPVRYTLCTVRTAYGISRLTKTPWYASVNRMPSRGGWGLL